MNWIEVLRRPRGSGRLTERVVIGGVVIAAMVTIMVVALVTVARRHDRAASSAARAGQVLDSALMADRESVDLETGLRGYGATGDRVFLEPWTAARAALSGQLLRLRRLVADNRMQERRASALQAAISSYVSGYAEPFVARSRPLRGAALVAFTTRGKVLLDALRARFGVFDATERAQQLSSQRQSAAAARKLFRVRAVAAAAILLAMGLFVLYVARAVALPLRRASAALARLAAGDRAVRLPSSARGEVGLLGASFNSAAERLAEREQELRDAAALRESVLETAHHAYVAIDEHGTIEAWNPAAEQIFGWSRSDAVGRALAELIVPERHRDGHRAGLRRHLESGEARILGRRLELSALRRRGDEFPIEMTIARAQRDGRSTFHAFIADISERRAAERETARQREHVEAIVSAMAEGYVLTTDGRIAAVNDAVCRLTGFLRADLIGASPPFPFWPPDTLTETLALREKIVSDQGGTFEVTLMRKDGARFDAEITARRAYHPDGGVLGFVSTIRDIGERKRHEAELARMATLDPLTGLLNHRVFHERLRAEIARAQRYSRPLSLVLMDVDRFKEVNDRHGHPAGDQALRQVAECLRSLAREEESLARVGGEEFAWLVSDADGLGGYAAAERARRAIRATRFDGVGTLTISAGVCEVCDAGEAEELYRRADQALYDAKRHGRDQTFRHTAATAHQLAAGREQRGAASSAQVAWLPSRRCASSLSGS